MNCHDFTPRLDAAALDAWIAALRSGAYIQARCRFRRIDAGGRLCHCVIGVLLDLVVGRVVTPVHIPGLTIAWDPPAGPDAPEGRYFEEISVWVAGTPAADIAGFSPLWLVTQIGLTYAQVNLLVKMGDAGASFATLAGMLDDIKKGWAV